MFGKRLRDLREDHDLKQKDLAKILGVSDRTIGMYEQERREPSLELLVKIADYFDVSLDYLLGRTNDPDTVILTNKNLPVPDEFKELEIEIEADRKTMPKVITEDMVRQIIEEELIKHGYKLKDK